MSADQSVSLQRGSPVNELTRDLRLIGRHVYYEQLSFWLNPIGAFFSVGFSVVFLTLLAIAGGTSKVTFLGGVPLIEYYVAGFSAYGVMSVCFSNLAITLVIRRENRQLMRLRLSPLPTWILVLATALNMAIISAVDIIVLLLVGALAFHVALPAQPFALIVVGLIGVACFSMMGVAASTAIPNQESAGPVVSLVFFVLVFLSGLYFPLAPGSGLLQISNWFPVRHMITAVFATFSNQPGIDAFPWQDILVMAVWGVICAVIAVGRFRWEPRRR
ncbi:MAG TPA: ABC transporter permease [Candidatus Dormibacteraeota bacterium]